MFPDPRIVTLVMVASAAVALWADGCPATFRFYTRAAL
jgi:hypothetical protein